MHPPLAAAGFLACAVPADSSPVAVRSLLVTNDFPPKVGGIQSYLWELWRRLPQGVAGVLTTPYDGDDAFDAAQPFPVRRAEAGTLLPTRATRRLVERLVDEWQPDVVLLDPVFPIGGIGPALRVPYGVVLHGAEVTVWSRLPGSRQVSRRVLRRAGAAVAAGGYPAREGLALAPDLRGVVVPPGVDTDRFRPLEGEERADVRRRHGLDPDRPLVLGVSRLVPRKGFDVLIDAVGGLPTDVHLAIAGGGRDRERLERRAQRAAPWRVRFLGRVPDADLAALYASADAFAMLCRNRWGGLEQEGFGIVFLEAAACAVPAVAGRSGGAHEAVAHGETGFVVDPRSVSETRASLERLLADDELRRAMGMAARRRAVEEFSYDGLAARLLPVAQGRFGDLPPLREELPPGS